MRPEPVLRGTPVLPRVAQNLASIHSPALARVASNERCTHRKSAHFVRHLVLDLAGTPLAGQFRPGQSFGVLPPGADGRGRSHALRLYSIASPTRGESSGGLLVSTTVKRTIAEHWETGGLFLGVASNYLSDLREGDEIRITGPVGRRFLLPEDPSRHDYLFFATGTGIAPFRGMLTDLIEAGVSSRIVLVLGAAYATDIPYHADLLRFQQEFPNLTYLTAISREKQEDGSAPCYVQDRLATHGDLLLPMLSSERTLVYVCGVEGMQLGIFQKLTMMLPDHEIAQYLVVQPAAMSDIRSWQRRTLHGQVQPTPRVFVEVY